MNTITGQPRVLRSPARVALLLCAAAPPAVSRGKITADRFRLPAAPNWQQATRGVFPEAARGVPLSLDAVSVARLGDRDVLWIPVLAEQPHASAASQAAGPGDRGARMVFSRELTRRSLLSMEPGTAVLHGVLVDVAPLQRQTTGVGLVIVTRVDEQHYDVVIESDAGDVLAAARGRLPLTDTATDHTLLPSDEARASRAGSTALVPDGDQAGVRRMYRPGWDLDPHTHEFPLFARNPTGPAAANFTTVTA
jgi:hypothetical protein